MELASNSLQLNNIRNTNLNLCRNTGINVVSQSVRKEEHEEALKWFALVQLPTLDRLRTWLFGSRGADKVDVGNLGLEEKSNLVDRLVNDNEKFLRKLKSRIDRVEIDMPTIEVRYENLKVYGEAYGASRTLPTFLNFIINIIEGILSSLRITQSKKKPFTILKDVSGIIKPGRFTLLLGPPGSGKTSLLLALAGKIDKSLKVSGSITYNGHGMEEFVPRQTAAYISQLDLHIGQLTVRETLAFSARCQGVGSRYEMLAELSRREKAANITPDPDIDIFMKAAATEGDEANVMIDYVIKLLGLDSCADTLVGDGMVRGISGGQKKRVTTGEMLVGPAQALFMDEISTGLDSSTTYQIVNTLRQYVHIMKGTAFISLLQPAPETYDLFDDIVLISDGQIVYQGPREHVLEFFESMGFKCPERKGVADFLQEVTSQKDQAQYWAHQDKPYRFVSVSAFSKAFQSHVLGQTVKQELATPYDRSRSHPAALATRKYGVGKKKLLIACAHRELLLMKRNSFFIFFNLFKLSVSTLVASTVFLRTGMHKSDMGDGGLYIGALFFSISVIMFHAVSEIARTIQKLPVFYKQRDMYFFPPWAYAIPLWILQIPNTLLGVSLWTFVTYYAIGFDPSIERLIKQYFLLLLLHQSSAAMFWFIGAIGRNMIIANTFGQFGITLVIALGGVVLSRVDVRQWWIWGYWSSPLMYAQNAILANEFTGHSWSRLVNGTRLGVLVMETRGFYPEAYWYWIGVAALIGFICIFNILYLLALTFLSSLDKPQGVLPEEDEDSPQKHGADASEANGNQKKGMVLPFEPHSITFDDITYSIDMPAEMRDQGASDDKLKLLKGVSGAFRPGILTALMGVSGAGKTTLLDVLYGRKTGGCIEGTISISGYPKNQATFARISGYCEQTDIHSPNVTVYESLVFSAWLRLPRDIDADARKMFIEEVMELVELTPLRAEIVGLPGISGLSTEQRKRLTIAVELVANPSIIFMDEPTSGLDARAAAIVMRTVRNTVNTGRTVVCTIHQPSIDIFEAFDELFLMKRGGQEIYVGPLGRNSCCLIDYFESIKGVPKITDGYNPATWMLDVTTSAQELVLGVDFTEHYRNTDLYRRNKALIKELSIPRPGTRDLFFLTKYSQPVVTQLIACLWKQHWSYWRNPPYTAVRFLFTIAMALFFGTLFWGLGSRWRTQQDLTNATGSMYASIIYLGFQYSSSVQPVVSIERTVFYRERAAGMYSALPYAFSQFMIEIPYVFLQSFVYGLLTYSMIGFAWEAAKFFWFMYFLFMSLMFFVLYGMMSVAVTPNLHIAAIISSFFYPVWNLFSGFVIPRPRLPIWWTWFYWADPVAHTLYGIIASQYGEIEDLMDSGETVIEYLRDQLGYEHHMVGPVAAALFCVLVLLLITFAYSIKMINFQRR